jgi:hypothetical protein
MDGSVLNIAGERLEYERLRILPTHLYEMSKVQEEGQDAQEVKLVTIY